MGLVGGATVSAVTATAIVTFVTPWPTATVRARLAYSGTLG